MRKVVFFILLIHLPFSLFALGGNDQVTETKKASDYKIILILPGPVNDQSWNSTNYNGLVASNNELGTNIEYVENVKSEDFEQTFRNYAEMKYDLIMAAGTQFDEAANKVAQYYPDTTFCVVNGMLSKSNNVAPIFPKEYEASFLAGIIASYITEKGILGSVGGFPNRAMIDLLNVYETTTTEYALKNRNIDILPIRDYANSWEDIELGKRMAESMINDGADVLFFYANQVGLGAIQTAKEHRVKFIGFSSNQNDIAPETVVASIAFDFTVFYKWAISRYLEGNLDGKVNFAGLKEGIFVPYFSDSISDEVVDAVKQAEEDAINGLIDFDSMLSTLF